MAYEDWDYLWRIGNLVSNPAHTSECCMFYRVHEEQTTSANFSNLDRNKDKILCFDDVISKTNSIKHRLFLRAELEKTYNLVCNKPVSLISSSINLYKRFRNKRKRLLTGTNWERLHGVNKDPQVFEKYLSLL